MPSSAHCPRKVRVNFLRNQRYETRRSLQKITVGGCRNVRAEESLPRMDVICPTQKRKVGMPRRSRHNQLITTPIVDHSKHTQQKSLPNFRIPRTNRNNHHVRNSHKANRVRHHHDIHGSLHTLTDPAKLPGHLSVVTGTQYTIVQLSSASSWNLPLP